MHANIEKIEPDLSGVSLTCHLMPNGTLPELHVTERCVVSRKFFSMPNGVFFREKIKTKT